MTTDVDAEPRKYTGRCLHWDVARAFGFLSIDGVTGGDALFMHMSALSDWNDRDLMRKGLKLAFNLRPSRRKPDRDEACDVIITARD
jgi:cold shock CspA family protein